LGELQHVVIMRIQWLSIETYTYTKCAMVSQVLSLTLLLWMSLPPQKTYILYI